MTRRHRKLIWLGLFLCTIVILNGCQCLVVVPFKDFKPFVPKPDAGDTQEKTLVDGALVDGPGVVQPDGGPGDMPTTGPEIVILDIPMTWEFPSEKPQMSEFPNDADGGDEPFPDLAPDEPPIDEPNPELPCVDGIIRKCTTGLRGVCRIGERTCVNGTWSACKQLTQPSEEICDGLDNDCDGAVDGIRRECPYNAPPATKDVGPCRAATQLCLRGSWGDCKGEVTPKPEKCDGLDNNCDGAIDEWLPIQSVGTPTTISANKGYEAHLYLVATQTGFGLGWSETGSQRVFLSLLRANGTRIGTDLTVTPAGEYGNIHGLSYDGKRFIVSWDTDKSGSGGDARFAIVDELSKKITLGPQTLAKGGRMVNPQVAFGLNYLGVTWSDFDNNRVYVQTYQLNGKPLSQPIFFSLSTQNSPYPGLSFSLDRLGVTWNTQAGKLKFAIFDRLGKQIGTTVDVPNPGQIPSDATVAGDLNGFLIVWADRANGKLLGQRIDRDGKLVGAQAVIAASGAQTPIMKTTSYGGIIAWVQKKNGKEGVAIGRVDRTGKLLTAHSWFAVPNVVPYLALAWADQGKGQGRGAIGWLDDKGALRVAPLGCR